PRPAVRRAAATALGFLLGEVTAAAQQPFARIERMAVRAGLRDPSAEGVREDRGSDQDPRQARAEVRHRRGGACERDDREQRPDELARQEERARLERIAGPAAIPAALHAAPRTCRIARLLVRRLMLLV